MTRGRSRRATRVGRALSLAASAAAGTLLVAAACGARPASGGSARRMVEIRGFEYRPGVLRVSSGDTIVWTNGDVVPHSVTADSADEADLADGTALDSPDLAAKARYVWVAGAAGTVTYHCEVHPGMTGRVVVR